MSEFRYPYQDVPEWKMGQTFEDLAGLIDESLGEERDSGEVLVACEDPMFPDAVVFGAGLEHDDGIVPYTTLLAGALSDLRGLEAQSFRSMPVDEFTMGLAVGVSRPAPQA